MSDMSRIFTNTGFLILILGFSLTVGMLTSCSSEPVQLPRTDDPLWNEYARLQVRFHQKLYRFGSDRWPPYESLLLKQKKLQIRKIRLQCLRFQYLMENHPERIRRDQGLAEFVNFSWEKRDSRRLEQSNPRAAKLREGLEERRDLYRDNSGWEQIRSRFRDLPPGSEYHQILRWYQKKRDDLAEKLAYRQTATG